MIEPPEELGVQDYTIRFAETKIAVLKQRFKQAVKGFVPGVSTPGVYLYPFISYWELLTTVEYWKSSLPIMLAYILLNSVVSLVYMLTILPVYTPMSLVLGPIGLVIAWGHMFLHTNMLTMMTIRLSQLSSFTMFQGMRLRGLNVRISDDTNHKPVKYYYPMASTYYFFNHVPWKLLEYTVGFGTLCILLLISCIPILGPFIFHLMISPFIARIYWAPYLKYCRVDNLQRESRFYLHLGEYTAFGMVTGQVETWPLVSALAYTAHALAICQWAQDSSIPIPGLQE